MPERQFRAEVGARLRTAITATHPSLKAWCEEFGVAESQLGNWLRGDALAPPFRLRAYCDSYGITMDFLYRNMRGGVASELAARLKAPKQA